MNDWSYACLRSIWTPKFFALNVYIKTLFYHLYTYQMKNNDLKLETLPKFSFSLPLNGSEFKEQKKINLTTKLSMVSFVRQIFYLCFILF